MKTRSVKKHLEKLITEQVNFTQSYGKSWIDKIEKTILTYVE